MMSFQSKFRIAPLISYEFSSEYFGPHTYKPTLTCSPKTILKRMHYGALNLD